MPKSATMDKPLTKHQLMLALRQVENVTHFSERHGIPIRTVFRLRKRGASPTRTTIAKMEGALIKEGILNGKAAKK